jgi:predicted O-linked N-acetylglucosamine transferase (SPINDLY family)
VIALAGETFVSRQSASLLQRLGRDEWIAEDHAGYVERAIAAAADIATLRAQRAALREATRLRLCDARAQADDFATLLRALWRAHCTQS